MNSTFYKVSLLMTATVFIGLCSLSQTDQPGTSTPIISTSTSETVSTATSVSGNPGDINPAECPNPLVELKSMLIEGDIPEHFKYYENEFAKNYYLGWSWLNFEKINPGADTYYFMVTDFGTKRFGVKEGDGKYYIQPKATIHEGGGGTALVLHASGWDGSDYTSITPELIPRLGSIEINYDLIAIKNGDKYDSGSWFNDWVDAPANKDDGYFLASDPITIDGITYYPSDGIFQGRWWSAGDLVLTDIDFSKGDIGETIRKKETPASFTGIIDVETLFPHYYLIQIKDIKNMFDETLPNNVRVGLRISEGEIANGEEIAGWKVFSTQNGEIQTPISFHTPDCPDKSSAILEMAPVCEWHDGEPCMGSPHASQKIELHHCGGLYVGLSLSCNWSKANNGWLSTFDLDSAFQNVLMPPEHLKKGSVIEPLTDTYRGKGDIQQYSFLPCLDYNGKALSCNVEPPTNPFDAFLNEWFYGYTVPEPDFPQRIPLNPLGYTLNLENALVLEHWVDSNFSWNCGDSMCGGGLNLLHGSEFNTSFYIPWNEITKRQEFALEYPDNFDNRNCSGIWSLRFVP